MMKKSLKWPVILSALVIVVPTLITGCVLINPEKSAPPSETITTPATPINPQWTPPQTSSQTTVLPGVADVVAMVKPSVVAISTQVISYDFFNRPFTQEGAGSGWIIDGNGIIVTNNHVVEGARTITVTTADGATYSADVASVATDPLNDLAIFKIDAPGLAALNLGHSANLRVGEWVIAIGNALGQGIRATLGIVSQKNVSLSVDQGQTLYDLIETDAAINPGNSGGPLVNLAGEVVGITSAKVAQIGVEGMGYAISIDTALPIIQELVNKGYVTRPYIGVSLYTVDQLAQIQFRLAVAKGVLILGVVRGAPADAAGLQKGDVIVKLGGKEVDDVPSLTRVLHAATIGQPLEVVYYRGSQQKTTTVVPVESPRP